MPMRSDEALVAYLDGELDGAARQEIDAWIEADAQARDRLLALAASAALVRSAYADILNEAVPERLIAAAAGGAGAAPPEAEIIPLNRGARRKAAPSRRWWAAGAVAAGFVGILVGGAGSYVGMRTLVLPAATATGTLAAATNDWLDNAAGYYKLMVSAGDNKLIDVPANGDTREALQKISQNLPAQVRLPNLKPWGLTFRGARLVVAGGRPAAQLVYTTDNKAIGPLTLIIGSTREPDLPPTYDRRQDVNMLYWRHQGRAYALVGQTDIGYLWGIANDVAWQLDAI